MTNPYHKDLLSRIFVIAILMVIGFWIGLAWPFVQDPEHPGSHAMERTEHRVTTIVLGIGFALGGGLIGVAINNFFTPFRKTDDTNQF